MEDINTPTIIEVKKGDYTELSQNEIPLITESKTEILNGNNEMIVITDENKHEYEDIFSIDTSNLPQTSISTYFLPISKYGTKEKKIETLSKMKISPYKIIQTRYANLDEELGIMPLLEASGTYVRVGITGPTLTGNRNIRYVVQYWSSSSAVFNGDGQDIRVTRSWTNQSNTTSTLGTLWSGDLGKYTSGARWSYTYNWSLSTSATWGNIFADTKDRLNDSRFFAKTGTITCYQGTYSCAILSRGATSCSIRLTFRAVNGEDLCHHNFNSSGAGVWAVKALPTTSSSGSTYDFTCTMPANFAGTMTYGLVPSGGNTSSPWAWGSASIAVSTTFSSMSMPTVSASRNATTPTTVNISWTAGGTTNKPKGSASRRSVIIAREYYSDGTWANVDLKYDINLESAGSTTLTVPVDKEVKVFAEYSVSGLASGTAYQNSNMVVIPKAYSKPHIKIGGVYKQAQPYIKISGTYRTVSEVYVKVGGTYRKVSP